MLELLFVIYLVSGVCKDFFKFYYLEIPIDFTLLTAIIALFSLLLRVLSNRFKLVISIRNRLVIVSFLLFWLWMLISLFYTRSPEYSYVKTFLFGTNFLTIIIVAIGELQVKKVIKYFVYITYIFLLLYFPLLLGYQNSTFSFGSLRSFSGLYLTLGLHLGIIILILKFSSLPVFNVTIDKYLLYLSFILLVLIGARGPLLFTIVAFILYYLVLLIKLKKFRLKFSRKKILFWSITVISLVSLIIYYYKGIKVLLGRSFSRLELIISQNKGNSINVRLEHLNKSIKLLQDPWIFIKGIGIGSYMLVTQNVDIRGYPHNIFLEVWVELGIIGLILFLLIFFSFVSIGRRSSYISMYLLLYLFLNLLISSSLVDIRLTICFFMLFIDDNKRLQENGGYLKIQGTN